MGSLVSVIVPVYKVEKYIHRCVDSILAQTFADFELILVDDGSPDNCGKICDEYSSKDKRIHVIHKENGGLSDARNAGIDWAFEHSNSEWLTFIDSDDWVHPKYLEALYEAVIDSGCSISVCGFNEVKGEYIADDESPFVFEVVNTESFFCNHNVNAVIACGKLYKKDYFYDIRYPIRRLHEDEFTTYKVLFKTDKCVYINQPLYFYYHNPESITKSIWNPNRLDSVEALFQSAEWLKRNGLEKAYVFQLKHQGKNIWYQYNCLSRYSDKSEKKPYVLYLKKSMEQLLKYSKPYRLFSIKQYSKYYDFAYPQLYLVYRLTSGIKNKLRKIKRKMLKY